MKIAEKCDHKLSSGRKVFARAIQTTQRIMKHVLFHLGLIIPSAVHLGGCFAVNHGVFGVAAGAGDALVSAAGASLFILVLVPWHYAIDCGLWGVSGEKCEMIWGARGLRQPLVKRSLVTDRSVAMRAMLYAHAVICNKTCLQCERTWSVHDIHPWEMIQAPFTVV